MSSEIERAETETRNIRAYELKSLDNKARLLRTQHSLAESTRALGQVTEKVRHETGKFERLCKNLLERCAEETPASQIDSLERSLPGLQVSKKALKTRVSQQYKLRICQNALASQTSLQQRRFEHVTTKLHQARELLTRQRLTREEAETFETYALKRIFDRTETNVESDLAIVANAPAPGEDVTGSFAQFNPTELSQSTQRENQSYLPSFNHNQSSYPSNNSGAGTDSGSPKKLSSSGASGSDFEKSSFQKIENLQTWHQLDQSGLEFTYTAGSGRRIRVLIASSENKVISLELNPENARDRRVLWNERTEIAAALERVGYTVRQINVGSNAAEK